MTPNIVCTCCGCWTCYRDNFNRPNGDVVTDAPIPWIPPGLFDIAGNKLVIDNTLEVLQLNHEITFENAPEYIVKYEIKDEAVNGQFAIFTSMVDETNMYVGVYDAGTATILLYFVQGPLYPADWVLINSQVITILPKWLEVTVDQVDFKIQVAVIDAADHKETCVAPYNMNGGTRCGVGRLNGADAPPIGNISIDNFSLCENKCLKGCLIGLETFDRESLPTNDLGPNWIEHETLPDDVLIIADPGIGTGGGICLFQETRKIFWAHPHPDLHTTMAVLARFYPYSFFTDPFGVYNAALANTSAKWIKLYACVDDPNTPTEWVSALVEAGNGHVTIYKAVGGVETALTTEGVNFPGAFGNSLSDLMLCVDEFGKVTLYGKDPHYYQWNPTKWVYVSGLSGHYCGIEAYGSRAIPVVDDPNQNIQKTFLDQFAFLKTKHPGDPNIVEWTVGGTIEIGDKFTIGITDVDSGNTDQITVIADNVSTILTAKKIYDGILGADPILHALLHSVSWFGDWDHSKIKAQDQSLFTGIAITKEADGSDPPPGEQTFVATTLQVWVKGAYDCPPCPPTCGPCTYCDGEAVAPETNTPEVVRLIINGWTRDPTVVGADHFNCNGYNFSGIPPNPHSPFPNFPGAFDCTDANDYPLGYNGEYVLHGCDCGWEFHFPTWLQWYYPDGPPAVLPPPDNVVFNSCFPGWQCDGFWLKLRISQDLGGDPTGNTLFWEFDLESSGDIHTFYRSDNFPSTECKLPRTLHWWTPPGPPFPDLDENPGMTDHDIQIIPEGTRRL